MGLEADVALDRVGPLRTPGLDCLLSLAAEIFLDCVAHQARLLHRFTFRFDTEPGLTLRRVANILHFAHPDRRNSRAAGPQSQNVILVAFRSLRFYTARVNRVTLAACRSLPVYPCERISSDRFGMSQWANRRHGTTTAGTWPGSILHAFLVNQIVGAFATP